ncbi:OsmC family peroxiredoxin [Parashewanella spongiae]|uniref:OsmC family peroxiredoxin n=1 Tax=Parashewanella spongiae TaxID=342950 RepID=A0A3A6T7X1_9GAMM|nr:OsmC family protein [Parashewanella spongiae]MCL1077074.1 OsmC family protein [Parashewanella spongiae]RJY10457.1 OsmC family peroxiredoxin [Parashewanella spongiae]
MSFNTLIKWDNKQNYDGEFSRDHTITFGSGQTVNASSASEYKGNEHFVNPEESLLAALSSCHMLTFLAIAHLKRLPVLSYQDNAMAILGRIESGKLAVTEMVLSPEIVFEEGVEVTVKTIQKIHEKAHANCFIANSISSKVTIKTN